MDAVVTWEQLGGRARALSRSPIPAVAAIFLSTLRGGGGIFSVWHETLSAFLDGGHVWIAIDGETGGQREIEKGEWWVKYLSPARAHALSSRALSFPLQGFSPEEVGICSARIFLYSRGAVDHEGMAS